MARANAANVVAKSKQELADIATRVTGTYRERSWQSRWNRRAQNLANWNAYHSRQDWSHKLPWQTQQTVSEFGISIEQSVGTLERGLTDTNDWLTVDPVGIGDPLIDADTIAALLKYYLDRIYVPGDVPETSYNLANFVGDAVKRALLESIFTAKVYGVFCTRYQYRLEQSKPLRGAHGFREAQAAYDRVPSGRPRVVRDELRDFRLAVDLVPWEDWFPDPSLLNKYVIHEVTTHISALSSNPDYDQSVVDGIRGTAGATYSDMYKRVEQDSVFIAHDPDEVRVQEVWGDLIDPDTGDVLATNSFWTVCNGKLLRPPTPNPFWHGKRPFVSTALFRTPNSTIHKALADDAVNSWQFLNELVSLMFDGALASVWGKHQMRSDFVENADDFQEGIPQAATFLLRPNTPEGYKAVERIDSGELPQYAMEMFNLARQQLQTAMASNDLRLGQQPPQEATATATVEAMQASGSIFESVAARVEDTGLEPIFELAWLTILQYESEEKFIEPVMVQILGPQRVLELTQMPPEQRFTLLAQAAKFKCRGLRGVTARNRVMTKLANLLQMMGPAGQQMLATTVQQVFSPTRITENLVRNAGIDPSTIEPTQQEKDTAQAQNMVTDALNKAQVINPQPPGGGPRAGAPPPAAAANAGSPASLLNASQDQQPSNPMAPKTPSAQIPAAPMPGMGG